MLLAFILNYQRANDTIECLHSLYASQGIEFQIILVDNGSKDDSVSVIRNVFHQLEIITLEENSGFTGGMNTCITIGLERQAEKFLLINNDTTFSPFAVKELYDSAWDVAVPKIMLYDSPERIYAAGAHFRRFPPNIVMRGYNRPDKPAYNQVIPLDYATGCVLMFKHEVLKTVGGFDPDYIYYMEDYDLSARIRNANFKMGLVPTAVIYHKVSRTMGYRSNKQYFYLGRNTVLLYRKTLRFTNTQFVMGVTWVMMRELAFGRFNSAKAYIQGVRNGLKFLRQRSYT
jgi:GT2 family glycosyltransferase